MNNTEFEIRPIEQGDREEFLAMSRDFYASEAVLHPVPEEHHLRAFEELMKSGVYARCYMLSLNEETAGYALLSLTYSREAGGLTVWIEELYLKERFRGRGAAKMFFSWLEGEIPAARYRLETEEENHRAKKLYRSLGYFPLEYEQFIKGC